MKNILIALISTFICQIAFAEYITILPVSNRQIENAIPELVSLSELHGKTTTIRYWVSEPKSDFLAALSNTNIQTCNSLNTTEDLLVENKIDGLYINAVAQSDKVYKANSQTNVPQEDLGNFSETVVGLAFTEALENYQTKVRSNVALASLIEEQTNSIPNVNDEDASQFVPLDSEDVDYAIESGLMAGDKTTIMDMLLSGMTRSTDYELPISTDNILISGIGGAILNGYSVTDGGSGNGNGNGVSYAEGVGAGVPEPSTWAMLLLGVFALAWFRKSSVKKYSK